MRPGGGKAKGNAFESKTAKVLSLWLTGGVDKTQLIPTRLSGGWRTGQTAAVEGWRQVGDLAANGPRGEMFRRVFGVELKHKNRIDLWRLCTCTSYRRGPIPFKWWIKLVDEARTADVVPMLIFRANNKPTMVMLPVVYMESIVPSGPATVTLPAFGAFLVPLSYLLNTPPDALCIARAWETR